MHTGSALSATRPLGRVVACGKRSKGYTIVELVIVVLLLGILAANAMPKFFTASRFEAMGFADASVSALRYAQKLALSSGCDTLFDIDSTGYALYQRRDACDSGPLTRPVNRPGGAAWGGGAPTGVVVSSLAIYFDGQGQPVDAASSTVLSTAASYSIDGRSVRVQPVTGFVQVL
jgi:MSHA pilin protein MshC